MKKTTIQIMVVLMTIAFIGIGVIQFVWLKRSVQLTEEIFNDKVKLALGSVKQQLEDDASDVQTFSSYQKIRKTSEFKLDQEPQSSLLNPSFKYNDIFKSELARTESLVNPDMSLNLIVPGKLDEYLKKAFADNEIKLEYNYGIYSEKYQDYLITDGMYNINAGHLDQSSEGGEVSNLNRSSQTVDLFNSIDGVPAGSLRIFFPNKTAYFLKTILPALLSSIVFTGLILFCFIYTIGVILRQKKVSIMKTDFINNMTHEFKTPIATISLATDSINNPKVMSKPDLIRRYAKIIKQENKRMLEQVEKVLQIAKLDKKDFQLKLSAVDLNDVVNQAVENTALKVSQRGGIIKAILEAKKSTIEGDRNHISNVIHNLLDNAEKYSNNAPNITLQTSDHRDGVVVKIIDKGIGMTKEQLKRIFEKFYRVTTGNLHDVKGFGLGLSYVQAITDAHNGRISVKSEIGKGSTFEIFFPFKNVS